MGLTIIPKTYLDAAVVRILEEPDTHYGRELAALEVGTIVAIAVVEVDSQYVAEPDVVEECTAVVRIAEVGSRSGRGAAVPEKSAEVVPAVQKADGYWVEEVGGLAEGIAVVWAVWEVDSH